MSKSKPPFPVFGIAHPSLSERYAHISAELERCDVKGARFCGVIGADLPAANRKLHREALSDGQVGCALAHMGAYTDMVANGIEKAFVIEDDAVLPDSFNETAIKVMDMLRPGEVISLHSPTMQPQDVSTSDAVKLGDSRVVTPFKPMMRTNLYYAIHVDAARRIASANNPVQTAADRYDLFYDHGLVKFLRYVTPAVVGIAAFKSTIGYNHHKPFKRMLSNVVNALPGIAQILKARRRSLRMRRDGNHILVARPSPLADGNPKYVS